MKENRDGGVFFFPSTRFKPQLDYILKLKENDFDYFKLQLNKKYVKANYYGFNL